MTAQTPTPHQTVAKIVTGHFRQGLRYTNWRPAGTGDWLLIYTVSGRGTFGHPDGRIVTSRGDVMLIRPGTPHDYRTDPDAGRWELLWAHFHPRAAWLELLHWPQEAGGLRRLHLREGPGRQAVDRALRAMHCQALSPLRNRDDLAMNALEAALLWCDEHNPLRGERATDQRIQRAIDYCCRHLSHSLPVETLADQSGLSVSRFAHLFREQVGLSPQAFIERQRLTRAVQLLQTTSMPVNEIALEVGFQSPFYFSLRFRRDRGMSPTNFRRRAQQPAERADT